VALGTCAAFPICSFLAKRTRIGNYEICKAAFEKALFLYPNEHLEMRQGARVILKSKE